MIYLHLKIMPYILNTSLPPLIFFPGSAPVLILWLISNMFEDNITTQFLYDSKNVWNEYRELRLQTN
jgi:hypothetical protein